MVFGILRAIAIILFLYLSWRSMRENYKEETLIPFFWLILLCFMVGGRISYGLVNWGVWNDNIWNWFLVWQKPGMEYVVGTLSLFAGAAFFAKRNDWKIASILEDLTWPVLLMLSVFIVDEFIRGKFAIDMAYYLGILLLGFGMSLFIKKKYRSFVWYHSGKKGFVFYFISMLIFALLSGLSVYLGQNILITILYLILMLLSSLGLFILGDIYDSLIVNLKRKKV